MEGYNQVIAKCFEMLAEEEVDFTELIYQVYLKDMPDVEQHVGYLDGRMKGRMLDQVYRLLMGEVDKDYLKFEVDTHKCYGATLVRYEGLLRAVKMVFKTRLGARWSVLYESAWDESIAQIICDIEMRKTG